MGCECGNAGHKPQGQIYVLAVVQISHHDRHALAIRRELEFLFHFVPLSASEDTYHNTAHTAASATKTTSAVDAGSENGTETKLQARTKKQATLGVNQPVSN